MRRSRHTPRVYIPPSSPLPQILLGVMALFSIVIVLFGHWHIVQSDPQTPTLPDGGNVQEFAKRISYKPMEDISRVSFQGNQDGKELPEQPIVAKEAKIIPNNDVLQPKISFPTAPEFDTDGKTRLHIVFSTDCSDYQHWQSYVLFFRAMKVGQPGHVTRIASGCSDKETKSVKAWHEEHITKAMSPKFDIHFTPHFSSVKDENGNSKGNYDFFNKPYGLEHWMENGVGMGVDPTMGTMKDEDVVIILIDPDMALLKPIGADFSNVNNDIIFKSLRHKNLKHNSRVTHGSPFAATYGFGDQWRTKVNIAGIAGSDSPALEVTDSESLSFYTVGPPYIATARDMYSISVKWAEFAPKVHKEYPHLLAEMFAYCLAAAHTKLPHTLVDSLMVSCAGCTEGWALLDNIPSDEVCEFPGSMKTGDHVPHVIHFCQRYMAGEWFFGKRKLPKDFFTCEHPLLATPPKNLASIDYKVLPSKKEKVVIGTRAAKQEAFMICGLTVFLNDAAEFFKENHCSGVTGTRLDKSLNLFLTF